MNTHRFHVWIEIFAVWAVFFLFGAWSVPDVNEAHYIGKAIHFWNPDWIPNDPFLQSKDAHWTFYLVFGWLSFLFSPTAMAWIGRITAWSLLAWSWQRLSYALIPTRWAAIPTALALAYYIEYFNMAGEWLIGGIEGKSLAYPFVFFALEAMLRYRWNRAGIFLGIASALHILVGGWVTLIAAVLFFTHRKPTAVLPVKMLPADVSPIKMLPIKLPFCGILIGGLLALCGLVPALMLDAGTDPEMVRQAHQIYVFDRLPHHLVPYLIKDSLVLRFVLLTLIFLILCKNSTGKRLRIFNDFIMGTLILAALGMILAYFLSGSRELSAEVLRFYWFRLSDIAVPMGVAIGSVQYSLVFFSKLRAYQLPMVYLLSFSKILTSIITIIAIYFTADYLCFGYFKFSPDANIVWVITLLVCFCFCLAKERLSMRVSMLLYVIIAFYIPLTALPKYIDLRTYAGQSRSEPVGINGKRVSAEWQDMCRWIKKNTPPPAAFWVPRDAQTFKWETQRSDVGTWKNVPQDAESVVRWYQSMNELYRYKNEEGVMMVDRLLTTLLLSKTEEEIADLQSAYGFDYILCAQAYEMPEYTILQKVYENNVFCLYKWNR